MSTPATVRKILVTASGSYAASALNAVTGYASLALLGPAQIGLYQAMLLVKNYALYANLGEVQAMRKHGAVLAARDAPAAFAAYQRETLTLALLTLVTVVPLLLAGGLGVAGLSNVRALTYVTVLGLFVLEYLQYFLGNTLAALNQFEKWTLGSGLLAVASFLGLGLVVPYGYVGFLVGKVLAALVFLGYLVRVLHYRPRLTWPLPSWRPIVTTGVPMSLVGLLQINLVSADRVVVARFLDDYHMGLYSIVPMIALPILIFTQSLSVVLFTRSSALLGRDASRAVIVTDVARLVGKMTTSLPQLVTSFVLALPAALTLLLPRYAGGAHAVQFALIGYTAFVLASPFANLFAVLDRQRVLIAILLASGGLILGAGTLAVRWGGGLEPIGAAAALGLVLYSIAVTVASFRLAGHSWRESVSHTIPLYGRTIALGALTAAVAGLSPATGPWAWGPGLVVASALVAFTAPRLIGQARRAFAQIGAPESEPASSAPHSSSDAEIHSEPS